MLAGKWIRSINSIFPLLIIIIFSSGSPHPNQEEWQLLDPAQSGPCNIQTLNLELDGIETRIFLPLTGSCDSWRKAPYPGLVFAHGFTMMGFNDGIAEVVGHGEHLASWGYWTAIPALPDDAESRVAGLRTVLDQILLLADEPSSSVYKKIDPQSVASGGYSLGGATALAIAARDDRIKGVVALDPVYHEGGFEGEGEPVWDPEKEGASILVPSGILGSPPSSCNSDSDYGEIFNFLAAPHRAAYRVVGASHCDFLDPGNSYCSLFCGGSTSPARTEISQRYMTAWLNYYLMLKEDFYPVIFGDGHDQDVSAGLVASQIVTRVQNFDGVGIGQNIFLTWDQYDHPIVAGYNLYRRQPGGDFPAQPDVQLGKIGSFVDKGLLPGQQYEYLVCSYDQGGYQHQCSEVVSITAGEGIGFFIPLLITP